MLREDGYPVFDTNSVRCKDADANKVPLEEVLRRYGRGSSYLYFVNKELKQFVASAPQLAFIDSVKTSADAEVLKGMFSAHRVEIWYLHTATEVRRERYIQRDIRTSIRNEDLSAHDASLEKHGIWELIKAASEVINMDDDLIKIRAQLSYSIQRALHRSIEETDAANGLM